MEKKRESTRTMEEGVSNGTSLIRGVRCQREDLLARVVAEGQGDNFWRASCGVRKFVLCNEATDLTLFFSLA